MVSTVHACMAPLGNLGGYNHWTGLLDWTTGLLDSPKLQNTNFEISRGQRTRAYLISVQQ